MLHAFEDRPSGFSCFDYSSLMSVPLHHPVILFVDFWGSFGETSTFLGVLLGSGVLYYDFLTLVSSAFHLLGITQNFWSTEDTLSSLPMLLRFYSLKTNKEFQRELLGGKVGAIYVPFLKISRGCFVLKHFHNWSAGIIPWGRSMLPGYRSKIVQKVSANLRYSIRVSASFLEEPRCYKQWKRTVPFPKKIIV